jgi:hypothetical protein
MSAAVTVDSSAADRKLQAVELAIAPARLNAIAGHAVLNLVKAHLVDRDHVGNAMHGRRSHFYRKASQSLHEEHNDTQATVTISATGFAQRLYGGTIKPVNRRFLTVPLAQEAVGSRASDFPDAFYVVIHGQPYLARKGAGAGKAALELLFILLRSVYQAPDRTVLPTDAQIITTARTAVDGFIARQLSPSEGSPT